VSVALRLEVRRQAAEDTAEAAVWYEQRSQGLGAEFIRAIDACLALIARNPLAFPVVHREARMALPRRFDLAPRRSRCAAVTPLQSICLGVICGSLRLVPVSSLIGLHRCAGKSGSIEAAIALDLFQIAPGLLSHMRLAPVPA
jgi:hypothetical protein